MKTPLVTHSLTSSMIPAYIADACMHSFDLNPAPLGPGAIISIKTSVA